MNHLLFQTTTSDFASQLIDKERIFRRIFTDGSEWLYLDTEQKNKAQEIFDEAKKNEPQFAAMSLDEFTQEWKRENSNTAITEVQNDEDADCMALNSRSSSSSKQPIFEARTGNYKLNIPVVRPPIGRGRPAEFNPYNFLVEAESNQMGVPLDLKMESEEDFFEEMNDECDTFQETLNANEYADNDLRYIANIVAISNSKKNGYPVLDLCGETHVHIT